MNNQPGILTYTDRYQVQKSAESVTLNGFFNEMRISKGGDLRNRLSGIFANGSMNRSHFFMNFRIKDWAARGNLSGYMMPVYGVKGGSPGLTRQTNYAEILFCREEMMAGSGFNEIVFGTDYLSGEETVELPENELIAALGRDGNVPGFTISNRNIENVCRIIEKLWEVQEINPRTRFIIRMERAEENSFNLLQQIYLLLPRRLRQQLGFETNISAADLEQIQNYEGVPLYVFTADVAENIDPNGYSFPVAIYDLNHAEEFTYNQKRIELIKKLATQMNEKKAFDLDYSEKKYLDSIQSNASSFKYYEKIVENMFSGALFWWTKKSVDSVEELEKLYTDQSELMSVQDYRTQALTSYYLSIYPNSEIAKQTVDIICDEKYPDRARILNFLSRELGHEKEIKAVDTMRSKLLDESKKALADKDRDWQQKMNNELDRIRNEFSEERAKLSAEKQELSERIEELKNREPEPPKSENDSPTEGKSSKSKKNSSSKLKAELDAVRKTKTLMTVAAGICAVAAIVMAILFFTGNAKVAELTESNSKMTTAIEEKDKEMLKLDDEKKKAEAEIDSLKQQLEEVNNQLLAVTQSQPNAETEVSSASSGVPETSEDVNQSEEYEPTYSSASDEPQTAVDEDGPAPGSEENMLS